MHGNWRAVTAAIVLAVPVATLDLADSGELRRAEAAEVSQTATADPVLTSTLGLGEVVPQTDVSESGGGQYRNNNQRNLWWNARAGRWDGILPTASPPAASSSEWWMWQDLGGSPTPVGSLEGGSARSPDAYWDEGVQTLYVFFSRGNSGISRFRRYTYDADSDRYVERTPSGGVNAPEMLRGGSRVTITKAPNGHLFAGVNYDNKLLISRSTNGGDTWADPVAIKSTAIAGEGHWTVFASGASTRVGFAATEDGKAPGGDAKIHFVHLDQNEADWTNPARWVDETHLLSQWEGGERADDELSAVVFENRVFVVIETEPLGDSRSHGRPQLIVFERQSNGQWRKHVILRYTSSNRNDAKRPVVTVNASSRLLVVTAGTTQRVYADMWYAPIDSLAGRDGQWSRLRIFEVTDPSTQDIYNTRLPLPRFPVTAESNLLTMIDDQGDAKNLWRQVVTASGGGQPPPVNHPPVVNSVTIDQSSPRRGDTLTVSLSAGDPDNDPLTYSYQWRRNGSVIAGATGASLDLAAVGGERGDRIAVRVTASDGQATSEPVTSPEVTIANSPPMFDQELEDRTDSEGDTVTFSATATDPDGDTLTYSVGNLPAGLAINASTGLMSGTIAAGAAGRHDVGVTVTDGTADATHTFTWTVAAREFRQACPAGSVPAAGFADVSERNVHRPSIDCVVWWKVAQGRGPDTYHPQGSVTRAQMATFMVNLLAASDAALPPVQDQGFVDIGSSVHRESINRLAAARLVEGRGAGRYDPDAPVTRAQMATFIVNSYEYASGEALEEGPARFTDVSGAHEGSIRKAAEARFTSGRTATTYEPQTAVRRDQMASFVVGVLNRVVADGRVGSPTGS